MKRIFRITSGFFIFILFLSFSVNSFAQVTRTIHKTFKLEGVDIIELDFNREIEVQEWTGSRLLVETTVGMEGANKDILEHLIEAGRYNLLEDQMGALLRLKFNNLDKKVKVRGIEVYENITLKFFVPEGTEFLHTQSPPVSSGY